MYSIHFDLNPIVLFVVSSTKQITLIKTMDETKKYLKTISQQNTHKHTHKKLKKQLQAPPVTLVVINKTHRKFKR